jgi:hypothetical protein
MEEEGSKSRERQKDRKNPQAILKGLSVFRSFPTFGLSDLKIRFIRQIRVPIFALNPVKLTHNHL